MHLGFAVQDVSDVFVGKTNPDLRCLLDLKSMPVASDGTIDVGSNTTGQDSGKLYKNSLCWVYLDCYHDDGAVRSRSIGS